MGKTTLLISRRNPFPSVLLDYFLDRGDNIYLASPAQEEQADEIEGYRHIPWNPRSPISARNTILSIENETSVIDEAVLLYEHGRRVPASASGSGDPLSTSPLTQLCGEVSLSARRS